MNRPGRHGRPARASCFLDLDRFKVVNDTLGHQRRRPAARRGRRAAAPEAAGEHLVARLGGDEFVILVEDTSGTDDVVARRRGGAGRGTASRSLVDGHEITVTASVGIVERPGRRHHTRAI